MDYLDLLKSGFPYCGGMNGGKWLLSFFFSKESEMRPHISDGAQTPAGGRGKKSCSNLLHLMVLWLRWMIEDNDLTLFTITGKTQQVRERRGSFE